MSGVSAYASYVNAMVARTAEAAGIDRTVTPHNLRRTLVTDRDVEQAVMDLREEPAGRRRRAG